MLDGRRGVVVAVVRERVLRTVVGAQPPHRHVRPRPREPDLDLAAEVLVEGQGHREPCAARRELVRQLPHRGAEAVPAPLRLGRDAGLQHVVHDAQPARQDHLRHVGAGRFVLEGPPQAGRPLGGRLRESGDRLAVEAAPAQLGDHGEVVEVVVHRDVHHDVGLQPVQVVAERAERRALVPSGAGHRRDDRRGSPVGRRAAQHLLQARAGRLLVGHAEAVGDRVPEEDDAQGSGLGLRADADALAVDVGRRLRPHEDRTEVALQAEADLGVDVQGVGTLGQVRPSRAPGSGRAASPGIEAAPRQQPLRERAPGEEAGRPLQQDGDQHERRGRDSEPAQRGARHGPG